MRERTVVVALLLGVAACTSSGAARTGTGGTVYDPFGVYPPRNLDVRHPKTRPERTNFTETSTYADVMAFIDSLKESRFVYVTTMGRTSQGRDIPLVVLSHPAVHSPAEAKRLNRPIVYVQGNIHGGEVEGKEALLSVLRDLSQDTYQNVLDSTVIVAAPIYNIDGNEAMGPQETNRSEQNGPALIGQRPNGQGLDLNRDYIKAEAPETRAALDLFRTWDPDVFIDLHTTDGSYHGYALTWAGPLNPAARFAGPYVRDTVLPAIRTAIRVGRHIETFPYGNFVSQDSVGAGWFTYDDRPRFGTNYYGLRGRMAILAEAYSHDPFRVRIASTYVFLMTTLSFIGMNFEDVLEVGQEADRKTTAFASALATAPRISLRARITEKPRYEDVLVAEVVKMGDSTRYEAGLPRGIRLSEQLRRVRLPIYDRFDTTLTQAIPYAWVIPAEQAPVVELLRRHGLFVEQVTAPATARGEGFLVDSLVRSARPFQGHQEVRLEGRWEPIQSVDVTPDMYVVRAGQPLGILAMYLLEPQSDDGLVTWNSMDAWIRQGARYPIVRVTERFDAQLRPFR